MTTVSRLFFALYPDPGVRRKLHAIAEDAVSGDGKTVPAGNLHITLVFLGNVDPERQAALVGAVDRVAIRSFTLFIDTCGWWRRSQLLWVAPAHPPQRLLQLHEGMMTLAGECQIVVEDRPYRPHITLARKVKTAISAEFEPVVWKVSEFCLFTSNTRAEGPGYEIIQRRPLT